MTISLSAGLTRLKPRKILIIILLTWFLINLVQALFTEILSDEAYYGMYGRYLAWGYFDHPPMVALLIRISSLFFTGNLGIRFMTVLLQIATLIIIWKTIVIREPDNVTIITYFIVAASICMFAAYGILATPDAPLLFFTALFLYSYRKFLEKRSWPVALLLSISMAGLIYSKYQAVLVIGILVLSDLRLLRSFKFWIAGIFAITLLIPHIRWQFVNHFPSLQYHLIDRSEEFRWVYLLEYFPNQMAVFNPFTLWAAGWVLVKHKPADRFSRALYFQIIGFIGFFLLMAFRGHVEPHWTTACSIPMIILITRKSRTDEKLFKYTRRYILPSIGLLIIIRIFIMIDSGFNRYLGYSGKDKKYKAIEEVAGDLPVIFHGSFQKPSLYMFFTGRNATVISSVYSRQTQFDIWQFDTLYNNKPAFVCVPANNSQAYNTGWLQFRGFFTDSLQTVCRIKIYYSLNDNLFHPGDTVRIPFDIRNTYGYEINFDNRVFPAEVCLILLKGEEPDVFHVTLSSPLDKIPGVSDVKRELSFVVPDLPPGRYHLGITLNTIFGPSFNSDFSKIIIEND